jgi:DNA-binding HxlR family transcriptional regulator
MSMAKIIKLCERRWALLALCALAEGAPQRAFPLAQYLGAGRAGVHDALQHLLALGLLQKTKGYGHPLRPEFSLTSAGHKMTKMAAPYARNVQKLPVLGGRPLGKWGLPILISARKPIGFSNLGRRLERVTDRALSLSLRELEEKQFLSYKVDQAIRPISGLYQTTKMGLRLVDGFLG